MEPNSIHHTDDLKNQHVLPQVVSRLITRTTQLKSGAVKGPRRGGGEGGGGVETFQTLQMTLKFSARGSVQMKEIPRGAALELYTLQA